MSELIIEDHLDEDCMITDEVIYNLEKLAFMTIEDEEIVEYIHGQCKRLLEFSKNKNESKEVASAINLNTFEMIDTVYGNSRSVDIGYMIKNMKNTSDVFLVLHNHPSGNHFSQVDLKTFVDSVNMTILIAVGNNGAIYIIEKTRQLFPNEILSIRKTLTDWKNQATDFSGVIEQISEFGIVYTKM